MSDRERVHNLVVLRQKVRELYFNFDSMTEEQFAEAIKELDMSTSNIKNQVQTRVQELRNERASNPSTPQSRTP